MANTFIQNVYYHYILTEPSLAIKFEPEFFSAKPLQLAFKVAKEYVIKYHTPPTAEQMKELVKLANLSDTLTDDLIDVLYSQKQSLAAYTDEWLYDETTNWAILENVKKSIVDAAAYLKLNQDDMEAGRAKEIVEHIKAVFNKGCILDFDDSLETGSDFWNAESHLQKRLVRASSGYKFIDYCLNGGFFPGGLFVFAGAPKTGKSLWLQNICAASVKKGENNLYITLELPEEMVTSRIGSNMFSIPSLQYEKYTNDVEKFRERIDSFRKSCLQEPGVLIVKEFPTSTLTTIELESYVLAKEEELSTETNKFKFKNVFIDYINIMRNYRNPNSENTYMKIKQIAEDLRAVGAKNGWAMISATQTNRSQFDSNDMTANQISESAGLGATVDVLFGVIADALMMAQGKYYLKCLYDRVAPHANKKKLFDCNFNLLRITENDEEGIIDATMQAIPDNSMFIKNAAKMKQQYNQQQNQNSNQVFEQGSPSATTDEPIQVDLTQIDVPTNNIENTNNSVKQMSPLVRIKGKDIF